MYGLDKSAGRSGLGGGVMVGLACLDRRRQMFSQPLALRAKKCAEVVAEICPQQTNERRTISQPGNASSRHSRTAPRRRRSYYCAAVRRDHEPAHAAASLIARDKLRAVDVRTVAPLRAPPTARKTSKPLRKRRARELTSPHRPKGRKGTTLKCADHPHCAQIFVDISKFAGRTNRII